jgi:hypothetical protein
LNSLEQFTPRRTLGWELKEPGSDAASATSGFVIEQITSPWSWFPFPGKFTILLSGRLLIL